MDTGPKQSWFRRNIGNRIERSTNKPAGTILAVVGFIAVFVTFSNENFSLAQHWPGAALGVLLLLGARYCFRPPEDNTD